MLLKKVSILTLFYDTICIDIVRTFYPFRLNYGKQQSPITARFYTNTYYRKKRLTFCESNHEILKIVNTSLQNLKNETQIMIFLIIVC